nr:hypothetical protein CFP56_46813 [Quercus suber]
MLCKYIFLLARVRTSPALAGAGSGRGVASSLQAPSSAPPAASRPSSDYQYWCCTRVMTIPRTPVRGYDQALPWCKPYSAAVSRTRSDGRCQHIIDLVIKSPSRVTKRSVSW